MRGISGAATSDACDGGTLAKDVDDIRPAEVIEKRQDPDATSAKCEISGPEAGQTQVAKSRAYDGGSTPCKMSMAWLRKAPTTIEYEHKRYVYHGHIRGLQADNRRADAVMPRSWFKDFLEAGQREGKLSQGHTAEGLRSFIRRCQTGEEQTAAFNDDLQ